jgi:hypothetical protein
MRYEGNFRRTLVKNGSGQVAQHHEIPDRAKERDYRQYNASAEDVIAMVNGAGYAVRFGKQTIGYFASERQAVFEAGRHGATAYKIVREGDPRRATMVVLVPLDEEEEETPTAAELIADKIRDQIGVGDAPLSPLAKQRVVLMLFSYCKDKQIAWECFHILYPIALQEQFDRLWENINEKEQPVITTKDTFNQYAESRNLQEIANAIIAKDANACMKACSKLSVSLGQFDDLYNKAMQNSCDAGADFYNAVAGHVARESVERRIDGDIFRMLKNEPTLRRMATNGNEEGIIDYLQSSGYQRREAEEICSEIISIGRLVSKI